jgi:hypothetical protein
MTTLVANVPPVRVWVRREYLRDLRDGFGEYTLGYWVTCKSLTGRALYFETYLTEYGALFDKLPLSAFLAWDPDSPHEPKVPTPDLELTDLQFWNGFDTGLTVVEKNLIYNMEFQVMTRSAGVMKGEYLFTIDNYHPHRNEPDLYFAETPDEHKSHNIVALENGQIGAYPNNRCRMVDPSLTNHNLKTPDFKVSTRYFDVEHAPKWGRLGECDDYFWKTPNESSEATAKINQKKEGCSKACQPKVSDVAINTVSTEQNRNNVAGLPGAWQKQTTAQRLDGGSKKKKVCADIDELFDR